MAVKLGMPVPEGFTITTNMCFSHFDKSSLISGLKEEVESHIHNLGLITGKKFGRPSNPLLVSVRSGAPVSMPGMMQTILNLGLNDKTVKGLAAQTNQRFALDSYRRFIQMYAVTVLGMDGNEFTERYETAKSFQGGPLGESILEILIKEYKKIVSREGYEIPSDVTEQLHQAILAVFNSWNSDKAKAYREIEGIPDGIGTAVNVQRMVFGNMNHQSGTGVAFTRNPNTGANTLYGDFLINAQGEDVVDGSSSTMPLSDMQFHGFQKHWNELS